MDAALGLPAELMAAVIYMKAGEPTIARCTHPAKPYGFVPGTNQVLTVERFYVLERVTGTPRQDRRLNVDRFCAENESFVWVPIDREQEHETINAVAEEFCHV